MSSLAYVSQDPQIALWVGCKVHTCSADRALMYVRSAVRAQTFRGHGTDDTWLAAQQFTGIRNGIPRNLSYFRKLLVTCTVHIHICSVVAHSNHIGRTKCRYKEESRKKTNHCHQTKIAHMQEMWTAHEGTQRIHVCL